MKTTASEQIFKVTGYFEDARQTRCPSPINPHTELKSMTPLQPHPTWPSRPTPTQTPSIGLS